ncbi:MAG: hypothetical protein WKF68_09945 [Daejeonella sp.]
MPFLDGLKNTVGVKGIGEVGIVGVATAVANAILMRRASGSGICR